jgi:hypothetical protein
MRLLSSFPVALFLVAVPGLAFGQDAMGLFRQGREKVERGDWAGSGFLGRRQCAKPYR